MHPTVAVSHNNNVADALGEAFLLLGEIGGLFRGRHVAIKPNDTWASPEDLTACTQADTLRALLRLIRAHDPYKITVTGGSGAGETDQIFEYLGLDRVISEEGAEFFDHNRGPFERVHLKHGPTRDVVVNAHIFSYDTLVSLAQHKVHTRADVTLSMKNIAMSYPAADYYGHPRWKYEHSQEVFFNDLHGFIAGMCHRFPIQLAIIAGHPAMIDRGPIGGRTFESELVIAGTDFVAVDSVGAFLLRKQAVRHIQLAEELGLGVADLGRINIAGVQLEEALSIFWRNAAGSR